MLCGDLFLVVLLGGWVMLCGGVCVGLVFCMW